MATPRKGSEFIPVGGAVRLISVDSLARELGLNPSDTKALLDQLYVPVLAVHANGAAYFNMVTLEINLYKMLRTDLPFNRGGGEKRRRLLGDYWAMLEEMKAVAKYFLDMDRATVRKRLRAIAQTLHAVSPDSEK